eukprot:TRINITY_DN9060_c0_g5_i4.p1 TRINITY_DN9060_c0_g5~~TRINITY_DN9060_c0_g5_i4.p1  ORF type:complete len:295 (+),score=63.22 TRINITY_DN9060_c0_g5_i4:271-1155(+)
MEAIRQAQSTQRPIFIYLHSDRHEDSPAFCQDILGSPAVIDLINTNFVAWAADIRHSEAYKLSYVLGAEAYPFTCILGIPPNRPSPSLSIIHRIDGTVPVQQYINRLRTVVDSYHATLATQVAEDLQREEERRLRDLQAQEYEEALERDRQREREEEERKQKELEARRAREEEEKRRFEEEQRQLALLREKEEQLQRKRESLPPEPEQGTRGAVGLSIRLPDGSQITRRFMDSDQLQVVFDYISCNELKIDGQPIHKWEVVTHYPKRVLSDPSITLRQANLIGRAVLFVQEVVD